RRPVYYSGLLEEPVEARVLVLPARVAYPIRRRREPLHDPDGLRRGDDVPEDLGARAVGRPRRVDERREERRVDVLVEPDLDPDNDPGELVPVDLGVDPGRDGDADAGEPDADIIRRD